MFFRPTLMAVMALLSTIVFADTDYTSESPDFEQHQEDLATYLEFGNYMQACSTVAVAAGTLITMPWINDFVVNEKMDVEPFIAYTRERLAPPDPFMNASFATYYLIITENPNFVKKYRLYQEKYEDVSERFSVSVKKFMANCESRSMRKQLAEDLLEAYVEAAKL